MHQGIEGAGERDTLKSSICHLEAVLSLSRDRTWTLERNKQFAKISNSSTCFQLVHAYQHPYHEHHPHSCWKNNYPSEGEMYHQ